MKIINNLIIKSMEERFYMVYMDGGGAPTYKHQNIESAKKEAERLSILFGKKTYVLRAGISVEPSPKTITKELVTPQAEATHGYDKF